MSRPLLVAELADVITHGVIPGLDRIDAALDSARIDLAAIDDPTQQAILGAMTELTRLRSHLGSERVKALLERAVAARR
jgi:hypothetical protein